MDAELSDVVAAHVGSIDNQDVLQLFLQIENNVIVQAHFLAIGSVAMIGGGEWLCAFLEKKTFDDIKKLTVDIVLESLALPPVKIHVAQLLVSAVNQCMDAKENV